MKRELKVFERLPPHLFHSSNLMKRELKDSDVDSATDGFKIQNLMKRELKVYQSPFMCFFRDRESHEKRVESEVFKVTFAFGYWLRIS